MLPIICFCSMASFAQTNVFELIGTVKDGSNAPLSGANILIRAYNKGTVTDENGQFTLLGDFKGKRKMEISFVGFKTLTQTVDFGAGKSARLEFTLEEAPSELDDVTVTGKTKNDQIREMAYTVDVIDTRKLINTGTDLNRVLDRTSGVRVREDGGLGSNFSFSLNGFSGRQVKFFLDGIPIDNFGSSLTPNNFPVNLAQRVEIYKGVLPITLGSDALGGAVNIISRTDPNYLDVSYGFGSFNTHRASINLAKTNPESGFTLRAKAFVNYSDNNYKVDVRPIDLDNGQRLPVQEVERFHDRYRSGTVQIETGVTGKPYADKLLVGLIASGNDKDIQTGVTMDQVFGARTANSSALIPTLKYKKSDLFTDGFDATLYAAYNMAKNQFIDTTRLRYNWLGDTRTTTSAELNRTQLENEDDEALANLNLSYALNGRHGIAFNYLLTDFKRESDDIENPDNLTFLFPQKLRKQVLGLAWQTDYERFTANLFSKLYLLKAESFEDVPNGTGVPDYRTTTLTGTDLGYGAAAAYFILPELQAKISYEHTFRLPEAVELLGDGLFTRRNSALRPENSDNINLGASYSISGAKKYGQNNKHDLSLEFNYLFRNSDDFIRLDQAQNQPIDRQFVNVGKVRTNAFEGTIDYSYANRFDIGANLTYQRIIDRQETLSSTNLTGTTTSPNLNFGFRIPNIPYLFGNFELGYAVYEDSAKKDRIDIRYTSNYVKEYFLTPNQLGANNQDNIPTQWSHNLLASYKIKDGKFNISLEIRNITDEALFDNYLLQKPGRSFFINLNYFLDKSIF